MTKHYEQKVINVLEIKPNANNARTHSEKQVEQIVASIKEFGFANPVLVDEKNGLIAGHGRLMAANILEMETVPSIVITGLTKKQKRAYMIADNQIALNSGWDFDMLKTEVHALEGFDTSLLGFGDTELEHILEGWDSDITITGDPVNDTGFKIKVLGEDKANAEDMLNVVRKAVEASGIGGMTVEEY